MTETKTIGSIRPAGEMFFHESVGSAKSDAGIEYRMSLSMGGRLPVIRSSKTGKGFTLSWQEIIELAIAAGIDEPEKPRRRSHGS